MRTVAILGATGSVGGQALEIVSRSPDLTLVGLAARSSADEVVDAARRLGATHIALTDADAAARAASSFQGAVLAGIEPRRVERDEPQIGIAEDRP